MNKHLLALATGLLLGTTAATAQLNNWDNLPTLEEWPLEPYMRNVRAFYALPNFELPDGKNAVAVRKQDRQWATWYLRDVGDSTNQFTWSEQMVVPRRIDINGDGYMDYLTENMVYYGVGEGRKPSSEGVKVEHQYFGSYVDVNGDGYVDAVNNRSLLLGAKDISLTRMVEIPTDSSMMRRYMNTKYFYYTCWRSTDGIVRYAVSYTDSVLKEPVRQSLCIYRMQVTGEAVRLELEHEIESVGFNHLVSGVSPFQPEGTNGREFVFMQRGDNANRTELYAIENGKWVNTGTQVGAFNAFFQASIDGDSVKDVAVSGLVAERAVAISGAHLPAIVPIAIMPLGPSQAQVIGDVNGDGFNDVGYIFGGFPREFRVALGRSRATGVDEEQIITQNKLYPNPADSIISLHASLQRSGKYSILLYSIAGERIAELRSGMYAEGDLVEQFDLRPLGLAPGAYILRLTGNGTFTDMQFIYGGN